MSRLSKLTLLFAVLLLLVLPPPASAAENRTLGAVHQGTTARNTTHHGTYRPVTTATASSHEPHRFRLVNQDPSQGIVTADVSRRRRRGTIGVGIAFFALVAALALIYRKMKRKAILEEAELDLLEEFRRCEEQATRRERANEGAAIPQKEQT